MAATRVILVCHGSTAATRVTAFPLDEPLEAAAITAATEAAGRFAAEPAGANPLRGTALSGPALRCRQTAQALGLTAAVDPRLADWDLGSWAGRSLGDVAATSPSDVEEWTTNAHFAGHGGETLAELLHRIGSWLDEPEPDRPARLIAVTHPAFLRAAVVHALQTPAHAFWRIDPAPLTAVELRGAAGRWSLRPRLIG